MSARDSTEDEAIQELSELNLRAHTQSVGLTGYDPFERLWNHNPNNLNMKKTDATPQGKPKALCTKNSLCAQVVTLDPVPNPSTASPDSRGHLHSSPQHPTAKLAISNPGEGKQPIRMINSDERMLVDEDTENLGRNKGLQSEPCLVLHSTGFLDTEGYKASMRSSSTSEPGTEKKKSVAEFFREHLSTTGSQRNNTLQRNAWEKSAFRPKEPENQMGSTWNLPTGGTTTVQDKSNMCPLDTKQSTGNATRARRPTANSRSSLSMLVFATWSLLTWKTAIAPTGLWGARTNTFGLSSVSSLPNLVWKPTIREEQSRIFPNPIPREL